ncbi:phosphodiester glycosidase family protein [Hyalangium sp.]|uniref:phosphodiester glycosidase family protein n=1 Tax=Hyalangium sp. TaxID=2028555 RepID=UPI002D794CA7|nr:phosphodiester glycosidase family protein [Hyalangium sp.]
MSGLLSAITLSGLGGSMLSCSDDKKPEPEQVRPLPLGGSNLSETRESQEVAPGVTYTRIARGQESSQDVHTVDVAFRTDRTAAETLLTELLGKGFQVRLEAVSKRAPDDPGSGPIGYLVRSGSVPTTAEVNSLRDQLAAAGYAGLRTVYTGEDGGETTGPWVVHVLEVDSSLFQGRVEPELGTGLIPERELLTALAKRKGALAAINGGYFVIGASDGTPGDMAGISVIKGSLVSEAVDGRTSLILPPGAGKGADIAAIRDTVTATASDSAKRTVDGLNRAPGLIRACGGEGGDMPLELPKHDFTCTDDSELIQFTPAFGTSTVAGPGVEAVLNAGSAVIELREARGGSIPPNGSVLAGTGEAAEWLRAHAQLGATIQVAVDITAEGAPLPAGAGVVNGGPRLLSDSEPKITAFAEGFVHSDNAEFYYRFGVRRNPRTLAGVTSDGKLLLVAVDGRQPGYSVGASFEESALIMKALGAEEAVNLDGGGSTGVMVGENLLTRPSDATGERPIGDAIVILP